MKLIGQFYAQRVIRRESNAAKIRHTWEKQNLRLHRVPIEGQIDNFRLDRHPDVWELTLRQGAVDKVDGYRAFSYSRGHALHIARAHIAHRKDARKASFEHLW